MPVSHKEESGTGLPAQTQTETAQVSKSELETKLEALLSNVEGVGKTEVILMTTQESGSFSSSEELKVTGVLISAEGGDNFVTVSKIQEAVMALFQIEAHKIKVMKMK